jgi:hypothetical protein
LTFKGFDIGIAKNAQKPTQKNEWVFWMPHVWVLQNPPIKKPVDI